MHKSTGAIHVLPTWTFRGSRLEDLTPNKLLRSNCLLKTALREGQHFPEWRIWHLSAFSIDHLTLGTKTARNWVKKTVTTVTTPWPKILSKRASRYLKICGDLIYVKMCGTLDPERKTQCSRPRQVADHWGWSPHDFRHGLWKFAIWIGEIMINHQFWGSLFKILCHSVIVLAQRGFPYWLMIIHNILRTRASHHNQSTSFISYISIFVMLETIETPKNDGQVMWNQVKSRFVDEFPIYFPHLNDQGFPGIPYGDFPPVSPPASARASPLVPLALGECSPHQGWLQSPSTNGFVWKCWVNIPNYSHLIGIMIINQWV